MNRDFAKDRDVCAAATPGPWTYSCLRVNAETICVPVADLSNRKMINDAVDDARFIVAAREGWPAALDRIAELENRLRMQDEALKRAGSAARFSVDPAKAEELRQLIGKPGAFADNGDELEKMYREEADVLEFMAEGIDQKDKRIAEQEAQNAVLRQALENLLPHVADWSGDGSAIVAAQQALQATPSEAAERVQGLVEALRFCYDATTKDKGLTMHEATRIYAAARGALAKWDEGGGK